MSPVPEETTFPVGKGLQICGTFESSGHPPHLRRESVSVYREGVVLEKVHTQLQQSYVFVGLEEDVRIDRQLEPGLRVTVKLNPDGGNRGTAVSPREPKSTLGIYWGYEVRLAKSFSAIFTESPHKKGYNLTIGTSDKGTPLGSVTFKSKKRRRALLVIGGVKGLEFALSNDDSLGTQDVALTFDHYVNVCPDQGSRTIRSEEALLISLALITDKLNNS
uniref:RNA methyltransferase n=1 Tax=Lygus hesperus TaxID=30085 RepID=A0A0A9XY25_LYGHE